MAKTSELKTSELKTLKQQADSKATTGTLRKLKPARDTSPGAARITTRDMNPAATKSERITMLLRRAMGASIAEIVGATGWQHHSIRGFISGTIGKRKGLTITSGKINGERRYRIAELVAASS